SNVGEVRLPEQLLQSRRAPSLHRQIAGREPRQVRRALRRHAPRPAWQGRLFEGAEVIMRSQKIADESTDELGQMPEVARAVLTRLAGTPLLLPDVAKAGIVTLLELAEGQDLLLETYGLVCLAKWLYGCGEVAGCLQIMEIACSATARLEQHNE